MAAALQPPQSLEALHDSQSLSILRIRDSVFSEQAEIDKRQSDVSTTSDGYENTTPSSLETDLKHYKDLFSKLRFSYIEQVTKEKFLRAVTSSPPLLIDPAQNTELEQQLLQQKGALQQQKANVAAQIERLSTLGKELVRRFELLREHSAELEILRQDIEELEADLEELRQGEATHQEEDDREREPHLRLPLHETLELLAEREAENQALDEQLDALRTRLPAKTDELERLEKTLTPLEQQKRSAIAAAKEARRRREDGGVEKLEGTARWYDASGRALAAWLGVEG